MEEEINLDKRSNQRYKGGSNTHSEGPKKDKVQKANVPKRQTPAPKGGNETSGAGAMGTPARVQGAEGTQLISSANSGPIVRMFTNAMAAKERDKEEKDRTQTKKQ